MAENTWVCSVFFFTPLNPTYIFTYIYNWWLGASLATDRCLATVAVEVRQLSCCLLALSRAERLEIFCRCILWMPGMCWRAVWMSCFRRGWWLVVRVLVSSCGFWKSCGFLGWKQCKSPLYTPMCQWKPISTRSFLPFFPDVSATSSTPLTESFHRPIWPPA